MAKKRCVPGVDTSSTNDGRSKAPAVILFCTLGLSWAVIPEVYGFLAPEILDLYQHHPRASTFEKSRQTWNLAAPQEVWVLTTDGTQRQVQRLQEWWTALGCPVPLRIYQAAATGELGDETGCLAMRELIWRALLKGSEKVGPDGLILSLAGGRKTMSADLHQGAGLMGCRALLHMITLGEFPEALRDPEPVLFTRPLEARIASCLQPVLLGSGRRAPWLDVEADELVAVQSKFFPLPCFQEDCSGTVITWEPQEGQPLLREELGRRERDGRVLLGNFLSNLDQGHSQSNWRGLYRLSPSLLRELRTVQLEPAHQAWLEELPKAELHLHLGGCLDIAAQRRVGKAVWLELDQAARRHAKEHVRPLLNSRQWPKDWPRSLTCGDRAANSAALLVHLSEPRLTGHLFPRHEERVALSERYGFSAYERPGELTGSAILSHEAALPAYAREVLSMLRSMGVVYAEIRGTPDKYLQGKGWEFLRLFHQALLAEGMASQGPQIRFLVIADRRRPQSEIEEVVRLAVRGRDELDGFVVGLDLAGDEGRRSPGDVALAFRPAFEACLRITIHAGEGVAARNIWEAAYHLHADRIGHGLSLVNHGSIASHFRDRDICLELCPTSNIQVVGFLDPALPSTQGLPPYPLRSLMQQDLPLTLCTDNPGICRTSLAGEYIRASRMIDGLSLWDTLLLVRQGFKHAFLTAQERHQLLLEMDQRICRQLVEKPCPGLTSPATRGDWI